MPYSPEHRDGFCPLDHSSRFVCGTPATDHEIHSTHFSNDSDNGPFRREGIHDEITVYVSHPALHNKTLHRLR